ncbi:MAG: ATP-dependent DNA helicase RecG [Dehalococcoidia bacterium]
MSKLTEYSAKKESLSRILRQEVASEFDDSTVIGGIEAFVISNGQWFPVGVLDPLKNYSVLDKEQRALAVSQVIKNVAGDLKFISNKSTQKPIVLTDSIETLKKSSRGWPVKRISETLGIKTVEDLILYFPERHEDFSSVKEISHLSDGTTQSSIVTVKSLEMKGIQNRKRVEVLFLDPTGLVKVIFFGQPWVATDLKVGDKVMLSGRVEYEKGRPVYKNPTYERIVKGVARLHTGRLVPVYALSHGINMKPLRREIYRALKDTVDQLTEYIPESILNRTGLYSLEKAVARYHYPRDIQDFSRARRRIAFDELFLIQLLMRKKKLDWKNRVSGIALSQNQIVLDEFFSTLPFKLTFAQSRCINEISDDLSSGIPMRRVLQGDVGSGKTLVALAGMIQAASNGYQSAMMVPTEVLSEQHFMTLQNFFSSCTKPLIEGLSNVVEIDLSGSKNRLTIALLNGSLRNREKALTQEIIRSGQADIIVGTHALIQDSVDIPNLALLVVDEQHRFGVNQKNVFDRLEPRPHLLLMSATPIPRSLYFTMIGDLDLSVIDQMPVGRKPVQTYVYHKDKRQEVYRFIRKEILDGRQAFVVCPLIEESESLQSKAAIEEYETLSRSIFPEMQVGLLHGRMKLSEKELVMSQFRSGDIHILVATAVIEVGVDIPNASIMVIDGAERFGLSQLHQFRGRVGRGEHQSYCILMSDNPSEDSKERMDILHKVSDGFRLADEDLRMRGAGDLIGKRQSGIPLFQVADPSDADLVSLAGIEADKILNSDYELSMEEHQALKVQLEKLSADFSVA